jgi:alpha-L-rhamnosidase
MSARPFTRVLGVALIAVSFAAPPTGVTAPQAPPASLRVEHLRTEYKENPLGIDVRAPRLSWQLRTDTRDVVQQAWQVRVARTDADLRNGRRLVWESGRVQSNESIHRVYAGPPLVSGQRYFWQVQVWDNRGRASGWSVPGWWEMGLLAPSDWRAQWIEPGLAEDPEASPPAPMLRRAFRLDKAVTSARAYVTSHGLYEMHMNGRQVSEDVLTPGWTSYRTRLQYQTYDVTPLLQRGDNVVAVVLGNGWFRGNIGFSKRRNLYGDTLALLLQIEVTYADGTGATIGSDAAWRAATGPILMSEIYHGETYDARRAKPGWDAPGFDDQAWAAVRVADHPKDALVAPEGPPVRRMNELTPKEILKTRKGEHVVDMGQNMVGWVRLRVEGPAGTTVTLRHFEVLDKDGNVYLANLRAAQQTITYTLEGGGVETYEPHFTFQGFRYVQVEGYPGQLTPASLTGIVVHSAMDVTGEFSTSHALLNQLQHNIQWGQKGNFVDVPTDCPQRDERLGWTGDAQAFAGTAAFNMDVAGFFTKWLKDLAADQQPNGSVPFVVPDVLSTPERPAAGSAGWADAAVIIPWTLYRVYGDTRVLEEQYPSMVKWVEYMRGRAGDDHIWSGDFHFGDWLAYATTRSDYPGATTGKDLIATAFYAHSTDLLARIARVLGKTADATKYAGLADQIKAAWVQEYVSPNGRVGEDTQTAYVLALQFDLLPDALRDRAVERLGLELETRKHLTTGFLGTPYLLDVLSRFRPASDAAYMLLERTEYPSWLYPVTKGATTIWERWDGIKPDGSFQDAGMNSFNHYAYGAVGEWMYTTIAGLDIDDGVPGYKHVVIAPRPGGTITGASARHLSMYGPVSSAWEGKGDRFLLSVQVPPNTRGVVLLPPRAVLDGATESGRPLSQAEGILSVRTEDDLRQVVVGSGTYRFEFGWR